MIITPKSRSAIIPRRCSSLLLRVTDRWLSIAMLSSFAKKFCECERHVIRNCIHTCTLSFFKNLTYSSSAVSISDVMIMTSQLGANYGSIKKDGRSDIALIFFFIFGPN